MINENAIKNLIAEMAPKGITVVAATKTRSAETVNGLKNYGITKAGENRVQEFLDKYPLVSGIEWHFIGRLQTNKVKYIVDKVKMIQSLDRLPLAREIENQCAKRGIIIDVLLELNAGEESKGGAVENELFELAEVVAELKHLRLKGMMCVPAIGAQDQDYAQIKQIFDKLKQKHPCCEILSLGMSTDYKTAIRHGSNMIRPGSLIFGERK